LVRLGICSCYEILEGFSMDHSLSNDPAQEISDLRGFQRQTGRVSTKLVL